jgi:hypothetical protein
LLFGLLRPLAIPETHTGTAAVFVDEFNGHKHLFDNQHLGSLCQIEKKKKRKAKQNKTMRALGPLAASLVGIVGARWECGGGMVGPMFD